MSLGLFKFGAWDHEKFPQLFQLLVKNQEADYTPQTLFGSDNIY